MWTKDGKKNFQVQRCQKLSCMRYRPYSPAILSAKQREVSLEVRNVLCCHGTADRIHGIGNLFPRTEIEITLL